MSTLMGRNRRAMMRHSDQRVKLMSEILQGIRVVKLYAWEQALAAKIEEIRVKELRHLRIGLYIKFGSSEIDQRKQRHILLYPNPSTRLMNVLLAAC